MGKTTSKSKGTSGSRQPTSDEAHRRFEADAARFDMLTAITDLVAELVAAKRATRPNRSEHNTAEEAAKAPTAPPGAARNEFVQGRDVEVTYPDVDDRGFTRVPGLYLWEVAGIVGFDDDYRFELAGQTSTGVPLVSVFRRPLQHGVTP